MGFFTYGSLFAIQTLWAGPWLITVAGYTPEESAQGLFFIYLSMLLSFLCWGYFVPRFSKNINDAIRLLKFGAPISLIVLALIIYLGPKAGSIHWAIFIVSSVFLSLTQPLSEWHFHYLMQERPLHLLIIAFYRSIFYAMDNWFNY